MKKIFTLIAAAFVALSVNAQTELSLGAGWDTSLEDVVLTGNVEFNYKNSYAAVNLISESFNVADYPSYELVLAAGTPTESLQFCVNENAWSGSFGAGVTTPTAFVPDGVTEITSIQLQACDVANLGKVEIIEFNLIDAQGGKHPTNYQVPPSWAADVVTPIKNATVSFTSGGAWTFANINGANGLSNQTITINGEAFPASVQLKISTTLRNTDATAIYSPLPEGATTHSVDVETEDGETITEIILQNTEERSPFKMKVSGVTATPIGSTGISVVKAADAQNGVRYNLAGQRVNESYKGVVIMNGKKVLVK